MQKIWERSNVVDLATAKLRRPVSAIGRGSTIATYAERESVLFVRG